MEILVLQEKRPWRLWGKRWQLSNQEFIARGARDAAVHQAAKAVGWQWWRGAWGSLGG
ncbi:hypothetical protein AVS7_03094 [Acidovorax sp. MR-S7]|nr:hypothetical protein AVS7_03094 [Acidovorax sp. MR-S7]